ncbi:FeoB-associated Cys-rich membrane protein [Mangrovimonas sp. AS18]|nr:MULTISPECIES: FeoB-associated Cys-rich membrane protein [Mangrovimonas]MCF1421029.1 FeoB-associated Cys-rich membrane protein [Mangrovimonas futianensis]NIK90768.1 FeoB-associated Cys-rich membrane protein [Mangrovimonas sp. CR14]
MENDIIQTILVFSAVILAAGFLVRKFFFPNSKKAANSCGKDDCGCH